MALDRHAKLDLLVRTAFRGFWVEKLSTGKQRAVLIPSFDIPRGGSADLILGPKKGTVLCLHQRSDYVAAYKHTVGQLIGLLAHFHQMEDREVREALRAVQGRPETEELGQGKLDVVKTSKRLLADLEAGEIVIALVTELPEVPQQAKELQANFAPIAVLLETWLPTPAKKSLCKGIEFFAVDPSTEPPTVAPLGEVLKPLLRSAGEHPAK